MALQALIDCYAQAMRRHPKLPMMLLTHVDHRNRMVLPVAGIAHMARARGIDGIGGADRPAGGCIAGPRCFLVDKSFQ